MHENLQNADGLTNHRQGSVFKRYILNLKDQSVKMEDLVHTEFGSLDLPQYNPKWEGVAKNRYTYLFQLMHQTKIDEKYHWPLHKYDDDLKKIVATWGPGMTMCQEPRFIANPAEDADEDDGIIMTHVYDFYRQKSSIVVIDPKTMTTLQEYDLPFKLSIQFHNSFFRYDQLQQYQESKQSFI